MKFVNSIKTVVRNLRTINFGFLLTLAAIVITGFCYIDSIPLYDSEYTVGAISRSLRAPFSLISYSVMGHPTWAYIMPLSLVQYLDSGNHFLLNGVGMLLALAGALLFHSLLRSLFGATVSRGEIGLMAAVYLLSPSFITFIFYPLYDYGVVVYLIGCLCFLERRNYLLASLCAVGMVFSKETGTALYFLILALYTVIFGVRKVSQGVSARETLKSSLVLLIPAVCLGLYFYYYIFISPVENVIYSRAQTNNIKRLILHFDLARPHLQVLLAYMFVINFNWLLTAPILLHIARRFLRWLVNGKSCSQGGLSSDHTIFYSVLLVGVVYILTRDIRMLFMRYIIPVSPVLAICAYHCLLREVKNTTVRCCALAFALIAVFLSNFITFDPVSRFVFDTYKSGQYSLLRPTTWIRPDLVCADACVYNLQHLRLHYLANEVLTDIRPGTDTFFVTTHPEDRFIRPAWVDKNTFQKTLRTGPDSFPIKNVHVAAVLKKEIKPKEIYYVATMSIDRTEEDLEKLSTHYSLLQQKKYHHRGYELLVYHLKLVTGREPRD